MTHAPAPPSLVVRGPESLPALVPHLVGFHPHESLVLLGLTPARRTVRVTVRVDLPSPDHPLDEAVEELAPALLALPAAGALEALLVVYPRSVESPWRDPVPHDLPWRDLVEEVSRELVDAGITCLDAVCVVGDRIRSYWCVDEACCPPEGRPADAVESLRVRSALVAQGSAPLPSRGDLVRALEERPEDDPVRQAVVRARDGVVVRMPSGTQARVDRFVQDVRAWGAEPRKPVTLTRLVVLAGQLCATIPSRDLLLRTLTVDPDPELASAARIVLGEAVRCTSGPAVAPVASVLAVVCWVCGDGAAARVALGRALESDPGYSLAGLVSRALDLAVPPWAWVALMEDLGVEAILGEEVHGPRRTGT